MLALVLSEMRYAVRKFARTPGLTIALLVTIALGIGSNVSVYGFIRGFTQSSYPIASASGIVSLFRQDADGAAGPFSGQEYLSRKKQLSTVDGHPFQWIGAARISTTAISVGGQTAIVSLAAVTPDLAGVLTLPLEKGAVISHRLWQSEFGGKADIAGEQILINGAALRVSGVAPEWLEGLYRDRSVDLWTRLPEMGLATADNSSRNCWVLARLQGVVHLDQGIRVLPYTGMPPQMAEGFARVGTLLGIAAGAVFFIACANVLSFLLGRAFARSHETALRVALGAGRGQLARILFWDSVVISVSGGALGLLLALWTARVIPALLFQEDAERLVFAPDLLSTITASLGLAAVIVACGLMPILLTSNTRPAMVLRQQSTGPSKSMTRLRAALVVAQMASCCVLIVAAAFLFDNFRGAVRAKAGQRPGNLVLATLQGPLIPDPRYFQQVEQAVRPMAGVSQIVWAAKLPGSPPVWRSFRIEPAHLPLRDIRLNVARFTADSLTRVTLPPKNGRLFGFGDQPGRAAILNESAAAELFDGNATGRVLLDAAGLPVEIVGVVAEKPGPGARRNNPTIYYDYTNQTGTMSDGTTLANFRSPVVSELAIAELDRNVVSPRYFEATGLPLVAGQLFAGHPKSTERRIGVVNQEAADLYFGRDPVGSAVIDEQGIRTAIIGVVRSSGLGSFQRRAEPAIYFPMQQDCLSRMSLIADIPKVTGSVLADLRRRIESTPGRGPAPILIETLAAHLAHTALAPLRIASVVLGASAATALLLSILGLFGALSDAARRRRREMAIRMALGAQRWRIVYHLLKDGGRLACAGTLLGMLASLVLSRLLIRITPGSAAPGLPVWLAAPLLLALAVLLGSVLPARRALLVNPLTVMRDEG